jgi:hypothetical protein
MLTAIKLGHISTYHSYFKVDQFVRSEVLVVNMNILGCEIYKMIWQPIQKHRFFNQFVNCRSWISLS